MPMATALRLCPELIVVPHSFGAYREASHAVMDRVNDLTPLVEQLSIDEAFLDVTMLPDPAEDIARRLQATINDDLRLPCSLGVATNKLVAKIANTVGKARARTGHPPNAIQVVPPGEEAAFLAPLPVEELWGVGPKTAEQLARLGLRTIGDIARWPESDLVRRFGKHGEQLAERARIDERPVETVRETKSISKETTFARNVSDAATPGTLRRLADGRAGPARRAERHDDQDQAALGGFHHAHPAGDARPHHRSGRRDRGGGAAAAGGALAAGPPGPADRRGDQRLRDAAPAAWPVGRSRRDGAEPPSAVDARRAARALR